MIHSFGDGNGEHWDIWHGEKFHDNSIGIPQNIQCLLENGLAMLHSEFDQFPEKLNDSKSMSDE